MLGTGCDHPSLRKMSTLLSIGSVRVAEAIISAVTGGLMDKNIENTNNQLKYVVIRSEKITITTFELFFEGHSSMSFNFLLSY